MKIALLTSQEAQAGLFIQRRLTGLRAAGIGVGCVVIDENLTRRKNLLNHVLSVAKRQAKVTRSSLPAALLRLVVFRLWSSPGLRENAVPAACLPGDIPCCRVPSVNCPEAVAMVRACECDASCLLGARILTKDTIQALGHTILNGHASDPRFVRGRPPVLWEVLNREGYICLTVHQAVEKLDAGPIYGQRRQEIMYCGGIGATIRATMERARVTMVDLFAEVLIGMRTGTLTPVEFKPGPVRTIPSISQLILAEILCRRRSRRIQTNPTFFPQGKASLHRTPDV